MNGEIALESDPPPALEPERPRTRAEQREATRASLIAAAAQTLVEEGYAGLTTRRVAERAGVAQSTLMHHFPTRDEFLIEAVTHLAMQLARDALEQIDLADLVMPEHREKVLDQAWREFSSHEALAAAQLWSAALAEPELGRTLRDLEQRLNTILLQTATILFPDVAPDTRFPALLDATVALIRGLVLEIPIWGHEVVDARWQAIKPIILDSAAELLDRR